MPPQHAATTSSPRLHVDGADVTELARVYGTPLHVVSFSTLVGNLATLQGELTSRWPAGVHVYYSVKANPALAIRRVLADAGAGADCNGFSELLSSLNAGVDPSRIVLNGNNKTDDALRLAADNGVRINIDDTRDADRLVRLGGKGSKIAAGIRVRLDLSQFGDRRSEIFDTTIQDYGRWNKWGMELTDAAATANRLEQAPGVELAGLHYHLGRHVASADLFGIIARSMAAALDGLRAAAGWAPRHISVGGGLTQGRDPFFRKPAAGGPWPRPEDDFAPSASEYADELCGTLSEELHRRRLGQPVLEVEAGRYLVANAGLTLTRVGTVKSSGDRVWVMVDTAVSQVGMSRSPNDAHAITVADGSGGAEIVCDVVGPLCVPDVIMSTGSIPRPSPGTLLAVLDTGAYADGEASNANSVPRPAVILVRQGQAYLVRRAETIEDVFARDSIPADVIGPDPAPGWAAYRPAAAT